MTKPMVIDMGQAVICTWLELCEAMEPLHLNTREWVDELHDVWLSGVPDPSYTVAVPGRAFDERKPRPGDNFKHIVSPLALATWIKNISARRGFPYNARQSFLLTQGVEDYGV